jgi:hypothetical protein
VRTQRLVFEGRGFDIELDFVEHRAVVRAEGAREPAVIALRDGLSVAEFYSAVMSALRGFGIGISILAKPYGVPSLTTPFAEDREHRSYDAVMVRRFWDVLAWSAGVLERFAVEFVGKQSPVQLFWHSFDLAMGRYSGRRAWVTPPSDPVSREAYTHEVISCGFWAGDPNVPEAAYYTYTAPEPATLTEQVLRPEGAAWYPQGSGHLGRVSYETIRGSADPEAALLSFFGSGYEAGVKAAGWDVAALTRDWIPAYEMRPRR